MDNYQLDKARYLIAKDFDKYVSDYWKPSEWRYIDYTYCSQDCNIKNGETVACVNYCKN